MTRKEKAAAAKEAAKKEEAAKEPTRAEKNIAAQAKQKEEADKRKELEKAWRSFISSQDSELSSKAKSFHEFVTGEILGREINA